MLPRDFRFIRIYWKASLVPYVALEYLGVIWQQMIHDLGKDSGYLGVNSPFFLFFAGRKYSMISSECQGTTGTHFIHTSSG